MHLFWIFRFWFLVFRFWFLVFGFWFFLWERESTFVFWKNFWTALCWLSLWWKWDVWRDLGKFAARFWWHLWVAQQFSRVLQGGCHPQTNGASLALGLQPCSSSFSDVLWWSSNSITEWESALNENRKRNSILHIPQGFFYWKLHNVL